MADPSLEKLTLRVGKLIDSRLESLKNSLLASGGDTSLAQQIDDTRLELINMITITVLEAQARRIIEKDQDGLHSASTDPRALAGYRVHLSAELDADS